VELEPAPASIAPSGHWWPFAAEPELTGVVVVVVVVVPWFVACWIVGFAWWEPECVAAIAAPLPARSVSAEAPATNGVRFPVIWLPPFSSLQGSNGASEIAAKPM
jgi:hypothetical protein